MQVQIEVRKEEDAATWLKRQRCPVHMAYRAHPARSTSAVFRRWCCA